MPDDSEVDFSYVKSNQPITSPGSKMNTKLLRILRFSLYLFLFGGVIFLTASTVHAQVMKANSVSTPIENNSPNWDQIASAVDTGEANAEMPPPPEKDQCLHCHIAGEETNLWTPLARWSIFGTFGLIFAFGVFRSASVWKTKKPWVPFTTRVGDFIDERYQLRDFLSKILDKPVPTWATRWWYCLGGITAFLFVILGATGIMLAFYYQPTPEGAYASIQYIETQVRFGAGVRMIHHWSANGMVIMCFAHMLRVFITGAFKPPRELNWGSGVILIVATLMFGFTGYLLPWDQTAYWASTVGSEIVGGIPDIGTLILVFMRVGWDISAATLNRFYTLHVLVLPIVLVTVMGLHFLMVRRQGLKEPL